MLKIVIRIYMYPKGIVSKRCFEFKDLEQKSKEYEIKKSYNHRKIIKHKQAVFILQIFFLVIIICNHPTNIANPPK